MEAEIVAVFYGMSVDCSLKILRYVWIVAACSDYVTGHGSGHKNNFKIQ